MLGALLCAFAARRWRVASAAETDGRRSGSIGLASPVAIYALDFWEHTVGLGLMLWGVVWCSTCSIASEDVARCVWSRGALFGAAATMRTEALVYLAVCGGTCLPRDARTRARLPVDHRPRSDACSQAPAWSLVANDALERLVLGTDVARRARRRHRPGRGHLARGPGARSGHHVLGTNRLAWASDLVLGGVIVAAGRDWHLAACSRVPERSVVLGVAALLGAAVLYLFVFGNGLGFVPGLLDRVAVRGGRTVPWGGAMTLRVSR